MKRSLYPSCPNLYGGGTVILRAFRKRAASNSVRPDCDELRSLSIFESLPASALGMFAGQCEKLLIQTGMWNPEATREFRYFLRDGELMLSREGRPPVRLKSDSPGVGYPLPTHGWQLRALCPTAVLKVPVRYLDFAGKHGNETKAEIELNDNDAEAQLYTDLHQVLKDSQYSLPVLPELAVRIGKAIDDPDTDNDDIARLIQLDPALSTRIMSVVNSAAFSGTVAVRSLQQAVSRLGRKQVGNLVFTCAVKDLFLTDSSIVRQRMQALWSHSCRVAAISAVLARYTPGLDPDQALLAGLVHDIGAIPLLHAASSTPKLLETPAVLTRVIDEMKAEVGRLTLQKWNFEHEFCQLANHAEDWFRLGTAVPDYLDVVLVAQLHAFVGLGFSQHYPSIDQIPAFKRLALGQLTPRHSIAVLEKAAHEIDEIESLLH